MWKLEEACEENAEEECQKYEKEKGWEGLEGLEGLEGCDLSRMNWSNPYE